MSICHTWVILSICVIISTCHIWVILSICHIWVTRIFQIWVIILIISTFHQFVCAWGVLIGWLSYWYGVASISRLLKIIRLFCKRALWNRRYSAKETYNFKEPTNRSHPVWSICVMNMSHHIKMSSTCVWVGDIDRMTLILIWSICVINLYLHVHISYTFNIYISVMNIHISVSTCTYIIHTAQHKQKKTGIILYI